MSDSPKFEYSVALPTRFDGRFFRSRLEARWAGFFKTMGLPYQYEPDGFVLPSAARYQPDFYLPTVYLRHGMIRLREPGVFIEVKPSASAVRPLFDVLSEFGCGRLGYRYPEENDPDYLPPWIADELGPEYRNFVALVGDVSVRGDTPEGHFQFGPWWDNGMAWMCCSECGGVKIDFWGGSYNDCPRCGEKDTSTSNHPDLQRAAEYALSMRFDRQGGAQR